MNYLEICIAILAMLVLIYIYKTLLASPKAAAIGGILTMPAVVVAVNKLTEIITVDEPGYISAISNMGNIKDAFSTPKMMLQYRTMQMIVGTVTTCIPTWIKETLAPNTMSIIVKVVHWGVCFIVILAILWVFNKHILSDNIKKDIFIHTGVLICSIYILLALPTSSLVLKICNYDGFAIYFSVLALSIVVAGVIKKNYQYAFWGTCICLLGSMEKISAIPYYLICFTVCIFIALQQTEKEGIKSKLIVASSTGIKIIGASLLISYFNLEYIRIVLGNGKLFDPVSFKYIAAPITYLFCMLKEGMKESVENGLFYTICLYIVTVLGGLLIYFIYWVFVKSNLKNKLQKRGLKIYIWVLLICMSATIVMGVYGSYFVPLRLSPFIAIENGFYNSTYSGNGIIYHYGAVSKLENIFKNVIYHYEVCINALPSIFIVLFIFIVYIVIRKKYKMQLIPLYTSVLGCLLIPCIFAIGGQPAVARYYGVSIIFGVLCTFYICINTIDYEKAGVKSKILTTFCACIFGLLIELSLFIPNIVIFKPIWNLHNRELRYSPKQGYWHGGEAMAWGEEMALAGAKIKKAVEKEGRTLQDITVFSQYGQYYLKEPNMKILRFSTIADGTSNSKWNENEYYIFSRFALYRSEIPEFIFEVEPVDTIEYNGEISAWIYRGNQLHNYKEYFVNN